MKTFLKIHQLLTQEQRRAALVLAALMMIGMVLETFGVGLVIPVLGLLTSNEVATSYPLVGKLFAATGLHSREQMVSGAVLALAGIYAIKTLFLGFLAWRQSSFAYAIQASLSQRLFAGYLMQPWTFHLQRNSAQLIRNATVEINQFTVNSLLPVLLLLTETLVVIGISALLLLVEPVGALVVVSTLGLAAWVFQRITRDHILRWGKARQFHEGQRIQHLQQGLGGAKDVKLLGREADFLELYREHSLNASRVASHQNTLKQLPRLWMELLAVAGLAVLVLVMLARGRPMEALLPTLGVFAAAAFRLMPSASRLLAAVQSIRYTRPVVDTLHREMQLITTEAAPADSQQMTFERKIALENISFRYPGAALVALDRINLDISQGSTVGFIGGSGAGKSTLVDLILGLLTPAEGRVTVDGRDIQSHLRSWQDCIGYVPQSIFLTDDTLRRNIAFGIADADIDDTAVTRAIRSAQLEDFVGTLPDGLNTVVGERGVRLSGGQRQRIGIARALYHNPSVLVLDEATSALDTDTEQGVMDAVNALRGSKTILIVAHRLSTVSRCDRIYRMADGRLTAQDDLIQTGQTQATAT